jgi:Tol biopolymer transport system component
MNRATISLALIVLTCAAVWAADAAPILSSSFESDLDGWTLVLNRGALADATVDTSTSALGTASVRVTPIRICSPDDRAGSTNIHLRYETLTLRADTDYVMSAWMRAARDTRVQFRVRRMGEEVKAGEGWLTVGTGWRRLEMPFRIDQDWDDAAPQIILGESPGAIWVDGVVVREATGSDLKPADWLLVGEQAVAPSGETVRLHSEFAGGLGDWKLRLNRGAEAKITPMTDGDVTALRVEPIALCAPDDKPYPTNIHLRYESIALRAGQEYRFALRMRGGAPRSSYIRMMSLSGQTLAPGEPFAVTENWQTFEWVFTLEEDLAEAVPQIQCGGDEIALEINWAEVARADIEQIAPDQYMVRGEKWIVPQPWSGDGEGWLANYLALGPELPAQFLMCLSARAHGDAGLGVALVGDDGSALVVEVRGAKAEVVRRNGDEREVLSSHELPSEGAVPVMVRCEDGPITITLAESLRVEVPAGDGARRRVYLGTLEAGGAMELVSAEGYELLPEREDGATERAEYRDLETGARIVRLTHSPYHDKHAYYDISPWSPDGSRIVVCSALPGQRKSAVWVMDADGTNLRKVGDSTTFGMHTGNFPVWAPDGESIYYRTSYTDDSGERVSGTARVYLAEGRVEYLPLAPRQVSWTTGRLLLMENKYDGERERGLYSAAPDGSDVKLLSLTEEIIALSPTRDRHDQSPKLGLTNSKWSPDGSKAMVVLVGYDARGRQNVKEIYIVNADGSELRFVMTFVHHHIWHPNSEQVIGNCEDGLYVVNADGTGRRKITDLSQGHPSFSPDGSLICTDCYGGEYRDSLVLIDVATGEVEKLCSVPTVHGRSHETGTHPHPCWAPDGKSLIYDSDETGHCQLYQVFVED